MGASGEMSRRPIVGGSIGQVRSASLRARLRDGRERAWLLVDVAIVAWLCWLFDAMNNLAPVRQGLAMRDGRELLSLERSLRLDPERALDASLSRHHALSEIVVFWYENVHIVATLAVFALLWWRRADTLGVLRATLVVVNLIALAVFWSFPTAPPRMLSGGYVDLVARTDGLPVWQIGASALHANQLCSLPSLHVAWATWSALGAWRLTRRRWLRAIACLYPLLTTYAVMATGNHYLLDALAGAGMTLGVHYLLSRPAVARRLGAAVAAAGPRWGARSAAGRLGALGETRRASNHGAILGVADGDHPTSGRALPHWPRASAPAEADEGGAGR